MGWPRSAMPGVSRSASHPHAAQRRVKSNAATFAEPAKATEWQPRPREHQKKPAATGVSK
jgi:hypothetical protein